MLATGVWHHIAAVWDGTYMRLYVNGVLDATVTNGNGPGSGTSSLKLGRNSGGNYYNGLIDEVRISNAAVYTTNFTPQTHLTAGANTKGLWKFDGQVVTDASTNGNNGTLQGGASYSDDVPSGDGGGGSSGGGSGGVGAAKIQWLVSDHLGTPRMVFDVTGRLDKMTRHDYLPFGEELFAPTGGRNAAMGYAGGDAVRQQFTSKERDVETGLDYFLARYYSSNHGRFTSPDEFGGGPAEIYILGSGDSKKQALFYAELTNPQSLSKYTYCYNNPLRFIDPDGRQGQEKTKSISDQLLEYIGRLWRGEDPQDGMLPNSGNGELDARKKETVGPVGDWDRLVRNATWQMAERNDEIAELMAGADRTGVSEFSVAMMKGDEKRAAVAFGEILLRPAGGGLIRMKEARTLIGLWSKDTLGKIGNPASQLQVLKHAFNNHGFQVGAQNIVDYMRKAAAFSTNGLKREIFDNGARVRYLRKDGYYIIKDAAGKIVSFGRNP